MRPEYTLTLPRVRPPPTSDSVSSCPPAWVPKALPTAGFRAPREPSAADSGADREQHQQARQHQGGLPETPPPAGDSRSGTGEPQPLDEPYLEAERRLDTRHHLEERVGGERELLHLGLAPRAPFDVGERQSPLSSRQDPHCELGEVVSVPIALRPGAGVVVAHRVLVSFAMVSRSFWSPVRIRVFAVPSGMFSALPTSAAVMPWK